MEEKTKLNLKFLTFLSGGNKIHSYKLSFDTGSLHIILGPEETYEIPEEVFQFCNDKAIIFIDLYDSMNTCLTTIKYQIYYQYTNTIYIEEYYIGKGYNLEIDFKHSKDLDVKINEKEFKIFDNIGTKDRHKLSLLNFNIPTITVNQKDINIISEIISCRRKSTINFYKLSLNIDDPEQKIIVQTINETSEPKLHLLNNSKPALNEFYEQFKILLQMRGGTKRYKNRYESIYMEYKKKIPNIDPELNKSTKYLEKYFKKHPIDFEIIFKYQIFCLFKDEKKEYKKDQKLINNFVKIIEKFFDKIKIEKDIKIYDKISLLGKISNACVRCKNSNDLDKINLFYIITSKCEKNSIIDKTKKIFNDFISKLSDNSKIFPYLLNIDSGVGYYKNEAIYTFDMSNITMIKNHLKELFPRVLLFYDYDNDKLGDTNKCSGCISINVHRFTCIKEEHETIIFDKKINDENFSDNMSVNMFMIILHELGGHKKITYNKNIDLESNSPKKIINEDNKLVELKRYSKYRNDDNEYILTAEDSDEDVGESGKFLELCFGKYNGNLISSLLICMKDKAKLIDRADLFASENTDILKKYVILKNKIESNNIKTNIPKNLSIEEELVELEKIVNKSNIPEISFENMEQNELSKNLMMTGKKRIRDDNICKKERKNKEKYMEIKLISRKNKINELEFEEEQEKEKAPEELKKTQKKTEEENLNASDDEDNEEDEEEERIEPEVRLKNLKKHVRETYGFKNRGDMIEGIKKILTENSADDDELCDLSFLLRFLYEVH